MVWFGRFHRFGRIDAHPYTTCMAGKQIMQEQRSSWWCARVVGWNFMSRRLVGYGLRMGLDWMGLWLKGLVWVVADFVGFFLFIQ